MVYILALVLSFCALALVYGVLSPAGRKSIRRLAGQRAFALACYGRLLAENIWTRPPLWPPWRWVDRDALWRHYFYGPCESHWSRCVQGPPGHCVDVYGRPTTDGSLSDMRQRGSTLVVNTGSYNYLGMAGRYGGDLDHALCTDRGHRAQAQRHMEQTLAAILGVKTAVSMASGYATNAVLLPAVIAWLSENKARGREFVVYSDEHNHASLIRGIHRSIARRARVYPHGDLRPVALFLEQNPEAVVLVVCEGLYSMHGTYTDALWLAQLRRLHPGRLWVYMDEAHSFGALGDTGRGLCEHVGLFTPPEGVTRAVDFTMVTFTKALASIGGAVCVNDASLAEALVAARGAGESPLPLAVSLQVTGVLRDPGAMRRNIQRLRVVTERLRMGLSPWARLLGERDSPVIPIVLPDISVMYRVARDCEARGVAVVAVAYPATDLWSGGRLRLCASAAHTDTDVQAILAAVRSALEDAGIENDYDYSTECAVPRRERLPPFYMAGEEDMTPGELVALTARGDGGRPRIEEDGGERRNANTQEEEEEKAVSSRRKEEEGWTSVEISAPVQCPKVNAGRIDVRRVLEKSGVGSAGPRGFLGTMTEHLELEEAVAARHASRGWGAIIYSHARCMVDSVARALVGSGARRVYYERDFPLPHSFSEAQAFTHTWEIPADAALILTHTVAMAHALNTMIAVGEGKKFIWVATREARHVHGVVRSLEADYDLLGGYFCGQPALVRAQRLGAPAYVFSASAPMYLCRWAAERIAEDKR